MSEPYVFPSGRDQDTSPITPIGRVTFNARVDVQAIKMARRLPPNKRFYQDGDTQDGSWDYMNPELVLMKNVEHKEMGGHMAGRTPCVISSLCAILASEGTEADDIYEKYSLAGIVQGTVKVHGDVPSSAEVSVTCGGLATIINTCDETIRAGDWLYWAVPEKDGTKSKIDSQSIPAYYKKGKIPVLIKRFKFADVKSVEQIAKKIPTTVKDKTEIVRKALQEYSRIRDRVFARAISSSYPGTSVDIVFGSYRM